jgi:DedD protein
MAKQQKMEDEDSLKRRARRRLIGAVALTTVVVVVLPMVLDKEPRSIDQNIELRIPDKDSAGEFNPKMQAAPAATPTEVADEPAAEPPARVAAEPPEEVAPAQEKSPPEPAAPEKAAAEPPPVAAVPAKPAVKPVEAAKAAVQSGFVVQFGAYSNDQAALDAQKKLSQQGVSAYIEKAGNVSRVRMGPFKTREEADKAHARLAAKGLKPIVMSLK